MRKIFPLMIVSMLLLGVPGSIHAFSQKGQDCSKCHTLSADQAKELLKDLIPNLKIVNVNTAPIPGLWEVGIDAGGRKAIIYIDYGKKRIISPATRGEIIDLTTKANLTELSLEKINKVDVSQIPLKDAVVMGDKNARYKVIVFSDPD